MTKTEDYWYKNAIFYGIEIKVFYDGNGDGIGDIQGVTKKLDYLASLGVTCLWLLPFYPSADRDNGYDVIDYYNIDPDYGTLEDFEELISEAAKRGIRVIIDLVVHHTSDLHPWFQESRRDKNSKYRNYYVWTDEIPTKDFPESRQSSFPGIEAGVWRWDGVAGQFYYHSFYHFEPDLNIANRKVQEEIFSIVEFWMKKGIAGFRIDAATMLFDRKGIEGTEVKDKAEFLESLRTFMLKIRKDSIMLGEADVSADKIPFFFNGGDRMQLLYDFLLNRYQFLSLARGDARAMKEELRKLPVPPFECQWVNFLRNLDELNTARLSPDEEQEIYKAFGPTQYMQVYRRGVRRRLAPMFGGDLRRLKMAYSLIFSLPGAAMIVYGEELGMGDDLELPEREAVRIPMQWENSQNAGFSSVNPKGMIREVLDRGPYRYEKLNVVDEQKDEASLINHIRHLTAIRKSHDEIGHGNYKLLEVDPDRIFAISYNWEGDVTVAIHNLSAEPCNVRLLDHKHTELEDFFSDGVYYHDEKADSIPLNGYGYRWFTVKRK